MSHTSAEPSAEPGFAHWKSTFFPLSPLSVAVIGTAARYQRAAYGILHEKAVCT